MAKNPNNEYSITALKKQVDVALAALPDKAKDENADWETRREWALRQLLYTLELYTGTTTAMTVDNMPDGLSPSQQAEVRIYFYLLAEWSLRTGYKPIIAEYIERAIGKKS